MNKPFFWLGLGFIHFVIATVWAMSDRTMELIVLQSFLGWFCWAVCALLLKLNQVAERLENSQRLQNAALRTFRQPKDL